MAYDFEIYVDEEEGIPETPTAEFLQDVADDLCTLLEARGFSGVFVDVTYKNVISAQAGEDLIEDDDD